MGEKEKYSGIKNRTDVYSISIKENRFKIRYISFMQETIYIYLKIF